MGNCREGRRHSLQREESGQCGENVERLGDSEEHARWNLHTGLAENRNNYKIPLEVFYRVRVFPFPPGKLHSSPCAPAELRT